MKFFRFCIICIIGGWKKSDGYYGCGYIGKLVIGNTMFNYVKRAAQSFIDSICGVAGEDVA